MAELLQLQQLQISRHPFRRVHRYVHIHHVFNIDISLFSFGLLPAWFLRSSFCICVAAQSFPPVWSSIMDALLQYEILEIGVIVLRILLLYVCHFTVASFRGGLRCPSGPSCAIQCGFLRSIRFRSYHISTFLNLLLAVEI